MFLSLLALLLLALVPSIIRLASLAVTPRIRLGMSAGVIAVVNVRTYTKALSEQLRLIFPLRLLRMPDSQETEQESAQKLKHWSAHRTAVDCSSASRPFVPRNLSC